MLRCTANSGVSSKIKASTRLSKHLSRSQSWVTGSGREAWQAASAVVHTKTIANRYPVFALRFALLLQLLQPYTRGYCQSDYAYPVLLANHLISLIECICADPLTILNP